MYSFNTRIRYSECDENEVLTIVALLNYFQDCSTFQSEDLGFGVDDLKKMGTFWVINYWQIDVMKMPRLCDEVTVHTRPYECKGFFGKRNFYMKDKQGAFLAKADSLWTYLSVKDGVPERVPQDMIDAYGSMTKIEMDYHGRKINAPKDSDKEQKPDIIVNEHMLDVNHHVNNGKYVEIAASMVPEISFNRLRVEYRKQAFLGDSITPVVYTKNGKSTVFLNDDTGKPFSVVEFSEMDND